MERLSFYHETTDNKMFQSNESHKTDFLNEWAEILGTKKLANLQQSKGYTFYEIIFCNIVESDFAVLYSSKSYTPNSPINCMVSALFLLHERNWSYEELMSQIDFNVEIRVALGLKNLQDRPFTERTLFNFKNRLSKHAHQTGENLLEKVFDSLTKGQLKQLKIRTNIQRCDSVLLDTNIRTYSRLSLLVEVLRRVYRILSKADQTAYQALFAPYLKGGEKFVYRLNGESQQIHLETLTQVYYSIYTLLKEQYAGEEVFQVFERAYNDHFKVIEEAAKFPLELRPKEELSSTSLSSPDDLEATCRIKRGEIHLGFVAFGAETCHPDNELNLVTKVALETNNTDDSKILENKLEPMTELTPDLDELHQDGGFGSEAVDRIANEYPNPILLVQTAIKGTPPDLPIPIEGTEKEGFTLNCPNPEHPSVKARKLHKNYRADFNLDICERCPFKDICPTRRERKYRKKIAVFRFKLPDVLKQKRHKAIKQIPKERRNLRAGVENLMARFHRGEKHTGKLKIRGQFNFECYVFAMGCVINFERIFRFVSKKLAFLMILPIQLLLSIISCQRTRFSGLINYG